MSASEVLPTPSFSFPMHAYNQEALQEKFALYVQTKHEKYAQRGQGDAQDENLFMYSMLGLCSGLESYWLYCKATGQEQKFIDDLEYLLRWDADAFLHKDAMEDDILENLLNIITFLSFDHRLRTGIKQNDLQRSLSLLLPDDYPQLATAKRMLTFVFDHAALTAMLGKMAQPNMMIRISDGMHALGLLQSGGVYYYYDPLAGAPQALESAENVASKLFAAMATQGGSADYLALNFTAFTLTGTDPGNFAVVTDFCEELWQKPGYRQAILQHKNIFHLGCRYNDYPMLDRILAAGYTYIPWQLDLIPELNEAVIEQDAEKVAYLLQHGVPVDYRAPDGITASCVAILVDADLALYNLLLAGADPNKLSKENFKLIDIAIDKSNANAVMLLLAFGCDLLIVQRNLLSRKFSPEEKQLIFVHASQLNAKLLGAATTLNLDAANNQQIIAFIHHAKLRVKINHNLNELKVIWRGRRYVGAQCVTALEGYCAESRNTDLQKSAADPLVFHYAKPDTSCTSEVILMLQPRLIV